MTRGGRVKDYSEHVGKRFGRINIEGVLTKQFRRQRMKVFSCRCDCGKTFQAIVYNVLHGRTTQCATCGFASASEKKKTHGLSGTWFYYYWKTHRGEFCEEWQDPLVFAAAAGDARPKRPKRMSIVAIDPGRPIGPNNFRFVAPAAIKARRYEFRGERKTVTEIAAILGVCRQTVHNRIEGDKVRECKSQTKR